MSVLDTIVKVQHQAPRIMFYGAPGIGKSTLASKFDNPLFLLTEENNIVGADSLPVSKSFEEFWNNLSELNKEESLPYKTIIIDSLTALDSLIVEYIVKDSPPGRDKKAVKTIAQAEGGYGAGFMRAERIHKNIKLR